MAEGAGTARGGTQPHEGNALRAREGSPAAPAGKNRFRAKTQTEIASLLDKSRQALKDTVQDTIEEKNQEIREDQKPVAP